MKKIGITFICAAFLLSACGNRTAKKEEHKEDNQTSRTAEVIKLDSEAFYLNLKDEQTGGFIAEKPSVLDFYATWCGPCQQIAPIMDKLAEEYAGRVNFYKMDVDEERDIAVSFGVQSIPTIYYIPVDGEPQFTTGAMDESDYRKLIEDILLKEKDI